MHIIIVRNGGFLLQFFPPYQKRRKTNDKKCNLPFQLVYFTLVIARESCERDYTVFQWFYERRKTKAFFLLACVISKRQSKLRLRIEKRRVFRICAECLVCGRGGGGVDLAHLVLYFRENSEVGKGVLCFFKIKKKCYLNTETFYYTLSIDKI